MLIPKQRLVEQTFMLSIPETVNLSINLFENVWAEAIPQNNKSFAVRAVYRHPQHNFNILLKLSNYTEQIKVFTRFAVLKDCNIDYGCCDINSTVKQYAICYIHLFYN